jgi:hypothetical protein
MTKCPCPFSDVCGDWKQKIQYDWQRHYPGLPVFEAACPWYEGQVEARFIAEHMAAPSCNDEPRAVTMNPERMQHDTN